MMMMMVVVVVWTQRMGRIGRWKRCLVMVDCDRTGQK
jgi:hypothetical protein